MNLDEIFRSDRYGPLLHLKVHRHYGYQSMWFLWQHLCNILSNFLHILISLEHYTINHHKIFRRNKYCLLLYLKVNCYYGYQSVLFLWQHIYNTPSNLFYILICNLKTIQLIFMKFSWEIDIVFSHTYNYIVTMDIN